MDCTQKVEATARWWSSPRFRDTKRPFSAEEVVCLRGTLPETYASNIQVQEVSVIVLYLLMPKVSSIGAVIDVSLRR